MSESCRPQRVRPITPDTVTLQVPRILHRTQIISTPDPDQDRVPVRDRVPRTLHKTQDRDRVLLRDRVPLRVPRTLHNIRLISTS